MNIIYGKKALPEHLRNKPHTDYPWPFSTIPRWVTAFKFKPPELLWGNQKNFTDGIPDPIPDPLLSPNGYAWGIYGFTPWFIPLGVAFSARWDIRRFHTRFGFRWDSVDFYYQFPSLEISFKKKYNAL